jgi:hypothetical protein
MSWMEATYCPASALKWPRSLREPTVGEGDDRGEMDHSETELDHDLQDLIASRIAAYRRGECPSFDADEVLDELEKLLDQGKLH